MDHRRFCDPIELVLGTQCGVVQERYGSDTKRIFTLAKSGCHSRGSARCLVWAYAGQGPTWASPARPGESTCAEAGCHAGTATRRQRERQLWRFRAVRDGQPGVKQRLVVTIHRFTQYAALGLPVGRAGRPPNHSGPMAGPFTSTRCVHRRESARNRAPIGFSADLPRLRRPSPGVSRRPSRWRTSSTRRPEVRVSRRVRRRMSSD